MFGFLVLLFLSAFRGAGRSPSLKIQTLGTSLKRTRLTQKQLLRMMFAEH